MNVHSYTTQAHDFPLINPGDFYSYVTYLSFYQDSIDTVNMEGFVIVGGHLTSMTKALLLKVMEGTNH